MAYGYTTKLNESVIRNPIRFSNRYGMKIKLLSIAAIFLIICPVLSGCGTSDPGSDVSNRDNAPDAAGAGHQDEIAGTQLNFEKSENEDNEMRIQMKIGNTAVAVDWEDNNSVEALKALCQDNPLTIQMSMYGGFEQVGSIGQNIPRNDEQTTTQAGDIVLYSGNQIVVFYGSNSWAYTRLGHIRDKSAQEMAELLGNGDVTITIGRG